MTPSQIQETERIPSCWCHPTTRCTSCSASSSTRSMLRIEQCSIRAKISLHEPQNLQNLFVVTREIDNMGDVGSEVRLHFYKETIHWNAGRRGTVWYNKAPAVSGAIPMTHITQYFHEHSGQLGKNACLLHAKPRPVFTRWIHLPRSKASRKPFRYQLT